MPIPLLKAYLVMLPRLEAEESFVAAERTAVGAGTLKKDARRDIVDRWRRSAVIRPKRVRGAAHAALLAASGIGVKLVPRPKRAADG